MGLLQAFGTVQIVDTALRTATNPNCLLNNFVNIVIAVAGLLFFLYFIFGAFRMMTAGGDEKAAGSAKNAVTTGLIGFLLIVASWFIVSFIGEVLGIDLLKPNIPGIANVTGC